MFDRVSGSGSASFRSLWMESARSSGNLEKSGRAVTPGRKTGVGAALQPRKPCAAVAVEPDDLGLLPLPLPLLWGITAALAAVTAAVFLRHRR